MGLGRVSQRRCTPVLVAAGLLGGCVAPVTLPDADRAVPAAYRAAVEPNPAMKPPLSRWWREFGSDELDRLQEAALENNRELKVAVARVAQAMAQGRVAESSLFPTVEGYVSGEIVAPEVGIAQAATREQWNRLERYKVGLRASYEVDLWGRHAAAVDSATQLALASLFQREVVALTLTAEVAAAYLEVLSFGERIAIAGRAVQVRRRQIEGLDRRLARGDATVSDLARFRVLLGTELSNVALLTQRRERAFHRLAMMVGVAPSDLRLEPRDISALAVPAVDAGLPSELLCRRPDLRRLESQLRAAAFDVHSVRANLLPGFPLTADIGYGARHLSLLGSPASLFFLATGALIQTLFDGGRKEAQLDLAKAKHLDLLQQYAGAILSALRDVEDALAGVRLTGAQRDARAEALRAARAILEATERTERAGAADLFAVLDSTLQVLSEEEALEAVRFDNLRGAVDLYRSLGGGSLFEPGERCAP